ncbi:MULTISPECIES: contact-dependent growth inhibition system immunity protein [Streptomyces]|uniref:Contact-dependent growth inhibition system immunity protein n=1 Tax=Streptomyces griseosporeus TaxID=1910 RepID=A0ABV3KM54_STRGS|nr:contact-dependent growth inhibition system immunity protein [Streptomyces actuosus]
MLSDLIDKEKSVEELEGDRWPDPPPDSTNLVLSVHALRRRPIKDLAVEDLCRLIGQDVGLQWLMPVALDLLRETAPQESKTGWYDDDLLTAVLTRKGSLWRSRPEFARHLDGTVRILTDLSPYVQREVQSFRGLVSDLV